MVCYDFVVGIPCRNNEKTIAHVVKQADLGIKQFFPKSKALIVALDGKSTDKTKENFLTQETSAEKDFVQYTGISGKGSALRKLFEISVENRAPLNICLDSDLRSVSPLWVKNLAEPLKEADYVTPFYNRYRYDGTITNQICFPLVYGVFCAGVRQPIGGDFGFTKKAASVWLENGDWESDLAKFGIDIYMTTQAILNRLEIKQASLGAKIHGVKEPAGLTGMFREVCGTLFSAILTNKEKLSAFSTIKEVQVFGNIEQKAEPFEITPELLKKTFSEGKEKYLSLWERLIPKHIKKVVGEETINSQIWPEIVYSFITKGEVDSLLPLWALRNHTYYFESKDLTDNEAEELIIEQAKMFFEKRDVLIGALE